MRKRSVDIQRFRQLTFHLDRRSDAALNGVNLPPELPGDSDGPPH